jgi:hypothetical protein
MSAQDQAIIDDTFLMERWPGKGGWTYVLLPHIPGDKLKPFGWLKVRGSIDGIPLEHYKLMPIKGDRLFLPVKASIRKTLSKEAGDTVRVILFADDTPYGIPDELKECLQFEPPAYERFMALSESAQKQYVEWIYDAKTEETKVRRIGKVISQVLDHKTG